MKAPIRSNWWVAPAVILAGMHLVAATTNWHQPGWVQVRPTSVFVMVDPLAAFILAAAAATLLGVLLRNRSPKLAGLLALSGVWVPLFSPTYNLVVRVSGLNASTVDGPQEYLGVGGVVVAGLTALGAIQNMTRRPIGHGRLGGGLSAPASP